MLANKLLAGLIGLVLALGSLLRGQPAEPAGWRDQTPLPASGYATYYNPGVMDAVLRYRLAAGDVEPCGECVGTVALLRAGDIGRKVWIEHDGDLLGPFLVIDCATPWDYQALQATDWAADVAYSTAALWGSLGGGARVTVWDRRPGGGRRHDGELDGLTGKGGPGGR